MVLQELQIYEKLPRYEMELSFFEAFSRASRSAVPRQCAANGRAEATAASLLRVVAHVAAPYCVLRVFIWASLEGLTSTCSSQRVVKSLEELPESTCFNASLRKQLFDHPKPPLCTQLVTPHDSLPT